MRELLQLQIKSSVLFLLPLRGLPKWWLTRA